MANYIVSYDLNGPNPTHAAMDKHMETAGWTRGRILETVWYVGTPHTLEQVFNHVKEILSANDQIIVVEAKEAMFRNLKISDNSLVSEWKMNR